MDGEEALKVLLSGGPGEVINKDGSSGEVRIDLKAKAKRVGG